MSTVYQACDKEWDLLYKIVLRRGGTPEASDTFNELLQKWLDLEIAAME